MAFPRALDPASLPAHVLFPEAYERSARMVARDFVFFGGVTVVAIVVAATLHVRLG